jgi:hypothetical protein
MTKTSEEALIAILVDKLGGVAIITQEDLARVDEIAITSIYNPASMQTRITTERPPEILEGEIVTAEPQSIEPHECEPWQVLKNDDGSRYCGACGVPQILTAGGWIACPPDGPLRLMQ